jgi:ribosomal 30S subunit maturation factor RimM
VKGREELYIPFIESICVDINLDKKEIVVDPPKGLLELNEI